MARDLVNLLAAEGWDDEVVDLVLVAGLGAGLVVRLGVVIHEPAAQFLDRRRLAGFGLVESGIAPRRTSASQSWASDRACSTVSSPNWPSAGLRRTPEFVRY